MANQFLGLSLFIMLLSFFLILNAISDFDEKKANPVLNSISLSFTNQEQGVNAGVVPSVNAFDENKGSTLDKIQGIFETQIAGLEANQNRLGTTLRMRMPFDVFEREVMNSLSRPKTSAPNIATQDQGFLLPTLVSLLDSDQEGNVPYKMDMVVLSQESDDEGHEKKLAKRVSKIASKMEKAGLPRKLITAGLDKDPAAPEDEIVDLYFKRYQAFDLLAVEQ